MRRLILESGGAENLASSGRQARPILGSNLVSRLSTEGLATPTSTPNRFSRNVGLFLPLNGNTEELLFLGEIRGT